MVRSGVVGALNGERIKLRLTMIACAGAVAGCAEVVVEDPPSKLGTGNPMTGMDMPSAGMGGSPGGTPVLPGNSTNPTQMERPIPVPVNMGGSGGSGSTPAPGGLGGTGSTTAPPVSFGPSGTELLFEDFDDGIADNWIADMPDGDDGVGAWSVVEAGEMNSVYAQSDSSFDDDSWAVTGLPAWTDIAVEARFRFTEVSNMEDATVMMAVRFASKESYYYLEYRGDGTLKLVQEVEGSESELADGGMDRVIAVDEWITLRLVVQGTTLTAFIDDAPQPAATGTADGIIPQGGIALGVKENSAVEFDDVRVTVP